MSEPNMPVDAPQRDSGPPSPTDAAGGVPPLSDAEIAEIRAAAEAEQRAEDGHICLTPRLCLALLDRLEALEAALLVRVPIRNHGSAIVCGCCDGTLALEQVGPGCCEMTGSHEAGCAVVDVVTAEMARAALGRPGTEGQP